VAGGPTAEEGRALVPWACCAVREKMASISNAAASVWAFVLCAAQEKKANIMSQLEKLESNDGTGQPMVGPGPCSNCATPTMHTCMHHGACAYSSLSPSSAPASVFDKQLAATIHRPQQPPASAHRKPPLLCPIAPPPVFDIGQRVWAIWCGPFGFEHMCLARSQVSEEEWRTKYESMKAALPTYKKMKKELGDVEVSLRALWGGTGS